MINEILGGDIKIRYGGEENLNHYRLTPYSYKPKPPLRITPETYIDLGRGLLNQIDQIKRLSEKQGRNDFKRKKMNLVDPSHPLINKMPTYPSDPDVSIVEQKSIKIK